MPQEMPLDIQWLVYALASNNALSVADALQIMETLPEPEIGAFAQAALDSIAAGYDENDVDTLVAQFQELVNYALEQAATGELPPELPEDGQNAYSAGREISSNDIISFGGVDIDISGINSYEDLPSLCDTAQLSDEELAQRVVVLLACLRKLGCSDLHLSGGAPPFVRRKLDRKSVV